MKKYVIALIVSALVAAGVILAIYFLFKTPNDDWAISNIPKDMLEYKIADDIVTDGNYSVNVVKKEKEKGNQTFYCEVNQNDTHIIINRYIRLVCKRKLMSGWTVEQVDEYQEPDCRFTESYLKEYAEKYIQVIRNSYSNCYLSGSSNMLTSIKQIDPERATVVIECSIDGDIKKSLWNINICLANAHMDNGIVTSEKSISYDDASIEWKKSFADSSWTLDSKDGEFTLYFDTNDNNPDETELAFFWRPKDENGELPDIQSYEDYIPFSLDSTCGESDFLMVDDYLMIPADSITVDNPIYKSKKWNIYISDESVALCNAGDEDGTLFKKMKDKTNNSKAADEHKQQSSSSSTSYTNTQVNNTQTDDYSDDFDEDFDEEYEDEYDEDDYYDEEDEYYEEDEYE